MYDIPNTDESEACACLLLSAKISEGTPSCDGGLRVRVASEKATKLLPSETDTWNRICD